MESFKSYILLCESYKDAKAKWLAAGYSEDYINDVLESFKSMVKNNQITGEEKDIGYWMKQSLDDLIVFVHNVNKSLIKKSKYKGKTEDVIEKLDNEYCYVYTPKNYLASRKLGDSSWCIVYGETYWDDYISERGLTPYYISWKDKANHVHEIIVKDSDISMIAVMINTRGNIDSIWDADDNEIELDDIYVLGEDDNGNDIEIDLDNILFDNGIDLNTFKSLVREYIADSEEDYPQLDVDSVDSFWEWEHHHHDAMYKFNEYWESDEFWDTGDQPFKQTDLEDITMFAMIDHDYSEIEEESDCLKRLEQKAGRKLQPPELEIFHDWYRDMVDYCHSYFDNYEQEPSLKYTLEI